MPRSVNHVASKAKRTRILKLTKGYYGARKNVWTVAKNTWEKGLTYAYRDRRNKKRTFRALWIQRINAAARLDGMSYSQLMGALHKAGDGNKNPKATISALLTNGEFAEGTED
jgi:large subunit ribosomal protein L20